MEPQSLHDLGNGHALLHDHRKGRRMHLPVRQVIICCVGGADLPGPSALVPGRLRQARETGQACLVHSREWREARAPARLRLGPHHSWSEPGSNLRRCWSREESLDERQGCQVTGRWIVGLHGIVHGSRICLLEKHTLTGGMNFCSILAFQRFNGTSSLCEKVCQADIKAGKWKERGCEKG